jgi:hypothetical protein
MQITTLNPDNATDLLPKYRAEATQQFEEKRAQSSNYRDTLAVVTASSSEEPWQTSLLEFAISRLDSRANRDTRLSYEQCRGLSLPEPGGLSVSFDQDYPEIGTVQFVPIINNQDGARTRTIGVFYRFLDHGKPYLEVPFKG